ncbi:ribosome biogenesis GTPase Der [Termitidicoccus mucosus]|uniref:GTPase Der n=1 Tax=Termitidicoccus mucosus TaxID=1184151 RepID=A0A178ID79_9BACT|nr:ribosome-associated GTPase EngA [Opitutaceae bacterium TSB47]
MQSAAIVGRPNVGKSRLFNRLARRRISIVHDQPGVTRDVISTEIAEEGALPYRLLDTGGLGLKGGETPAQLIAASERQVSFAIDTADLILFVLDGLEGLTALDTRVAGQLRRSKKNVLLVVNKADFGEEKIDLADAYRLGLGEPVFVSAEHGRGEAELRDKIQERLATAAADKGARAFQPAAHADADADTDDAPLTICFVGRPNVGKSSLANRLLRSDRLIVSDHPGTTRDAITIPFEFKGRNGRMYPFKLIDTAGIRAATKLSSPVEYFSRLRSLDAIKETDVVFLVLDAIDGVTQQDKAIAGEALKERKPVIIVVNKWDLVRDAFAAGAHLDAIDGATAFRNERDYREKFERAVFDRLFFTPGAPLIFVSALSGYEVDRMLNAAVKLHRLVDKKIPTARLNQCIAALAERHPPPAVGGRRFRIYYATQTGNRPFRIKIFCNREEKLTESYRRYLEAGVVEEFKLGGCPVYFDLVGKTHDENRTGRYSRAKREHLARISRTQNPGDNNEPPDTPYETIED